ncbi:MAG: glycoside hydrolase family 125 protein [Jiangellaceae bacterium]
MQRKPFDVGNGLVCASFGLDGSLLAVGAAHPVVGFVELTAAPAFPAERDGDADAVRRHRVRLLDSSHAVLRIAGASADVAPGEAAWRVRGPGWQARANVWALPDRPVVVQRYEIEPSGADRLRLRFAGRLDRPGYAEITPVGPIPPALGRSTVVADGPALELTAPGTDPLVSASVEASAHGGALAGWDIDDGGASLEVTWDSAVSAVELRLTVTLRAGTPSIGAVGPLPRLLRDADGLDLISTGALRYTLGCTSVAVSDRSCCIITDHRLLPLSWTRDAYYQAALVLACLAAVPGGSDVGRHHLAWLWGPGRDEAGLWQRSHLTTGAVKDPAYQADQQLYPLLELADYRRVTSTWPPAPGDEADAAGFAWGRLVRAVWTRLPRAIGGLLPADENPADDPSGLPLLLSNQLLLAYVARRLAEWEQELGLEDLRLGDEAAEALAAIRTAFSCDGPFGVQWAYASDGEKGRRLYHDANDVPTALAPLWGLCAPDDPQWRATMRFAWSPHNPGFVAGPYGGLGSAHTPGVWPLGDAQEWAVAMSIGDHDSAERVTGRLGLVASDDGMLPETYDPQTGAWLARHWFAWPGALVGLLHQTVHHRTGPWVGH